MTPVAMKTRKIITMDTLDRYIILLRGINVGGKNILPMAPLKTCLEEAGFEGVSTYIQSGNIVLGSASEPADQIKELIEAKFGISADVLAQTQTMFMQAVANNPYTDFDGKTVHFYFCTSEPSPDHAKLQSLTDNDERYEVLGRVLYLHAPKGIGRSKLAAKAETYLGVRATARNLNTVNKLIQLL